MTDPTGENGAERAEDEQTSEPRDARGRFGPGNHYSPGRPRGFAHVARLILDETGDGATLVAWALAVWRDPERTHAERRDAHEWLALRALGKPVAYSEIAATFAHADESPLRARLESLNASTLVQIQGLLRPAPALALAPAAVIDDET